MMTLQATHTPTDFYCAHADDNLRLTPVDCCHALIRAIIARAFWDAQGRVGTASNLTDRRRYEIMVEAREFFEGRWCLHLVESIGCDPKLLGALGLGQ